MSEVSQSGVAPSDEEDDDADDEGGASPPPRKKPAWLFVIIGLSLGVLVVAGFRQVQELRDRPGKGVTLASKPAQTRKAWIDDGYFELVPAIRMPSRVDGRSRIEVWLKVPEGEKLSAKHLDDQDRWTLVYPKGTTADRLEMPDGDHVVDVRGTTLEGDGVESFHVYRRHGTGMRGFVWRRDDEVQQEEATRVLMAHAKDTEHENQQGLDGLLSNNACGPCHAHERPVAKKQQRNQPNRSSDSAGFFLPDTVLQDRVVFEQHRPREMNADDPYIKFHCVAEGGADGDAVWTEHKNGTKWPSCADGSNPIGAVDVPAGLKVDDIHVVRLCKSRKALYDRMDDVAKKAFADGFASCNIK